MIQGSQNLFARGLKHLGNNFCFFDSSRALKGFAFLRNSISFCPDLSSRYKSRIGIGMSGGALSALAANLFSCSQVHAQGHEVLKLTFSARAPSIPRIPGSRVDLVVEMVGGADLYLTTEKIHFSYKISAQLQDSNRFLSWVDQRVKITFKLFDEKGNLLTAFTDIYGAPGVSEKIFSESRDTLSKTRSIVASLSYS